MDHIGLHPKLGVQVRSQNDAESRFGILMGAKSFRMACYFVLGVAVCPEPA